MQYKERPNCGAHLDHEERCDCDKENKKVCVPTDQSKTQTNVHNK